MVDGVQEIGVSHQSGDKKYGIIESIKKLPQVQKALSWIDRRSQEAIPVPVAPPQEAVPTIHYETLASEAQRNIQNPTQIMLGNEDIYCVPSRHYPIDEEDPTSGALLGFKLLPCLVVVKQDGTTVALTDKGTVGRNAANSVVVPGVSVSRTQVELTPGYDEFTLKNLNPANETRIQDIPKTELHQQERLPTGTLIPLRLQYDHQLTMRAGNKELVLKYGRGGVPVVRIDGQDIYFPVDTNEVGRITVGRDNESEIHIDDPLVSRKHLQIIRVGIGVGEDTTFFLLDTSTNGTMFEVERKKQVVTPEQKPSIIDEALHRWTNSFDKRGNPWLQRKGELLRNNSLEVIAYGAYGAIRVIAPEKRQIDVQKMQIPQIEQRVSDIIGGYPKDTPIDIVLAPGKKYVARAVADARGNYILLDMDNDTEGVVAHELVHAELGKKYGPSALPLASEGAAVIIGQMACPDDKKANNVRRLYGYNDVVSLLAEDRSIGLSPTALNENAGRKLEEDIYEYAYFFGGYFGEFFISKYGLENFLTFYKNTCGDVKDQNTGRTLAQRGKMLGGIQQRELTAAALQRTAKEASIRGLTPEGFSREFSIYLKQQVSSDAGLFTQANVLLKRMFL